LSERHRVVVTGGSRGIGHAAAAALAERGWQVTLIARDERALTRAASALPGEGHDTFALDVTDEDAWERAAPKLGRAHGLVCAAAVLDPIGPVGGYAIRDFRRTLDINVTGTLLAITTCLPGLRANRGAIVTFSGGGATTPLRRFDAYATSKAAVVRLSENLAVELAQDGVRVNCVAPGFVATEMHRGTLAAGPELVGSDYYERTRADLERGGVPASEAAELVCRLLDRDVDTQFTGKLISAQWDQWRDPTFCRRLAAEPDLATLRRIDDMMYSTVVRGESDER
jgi:NAD(P)-dependent dehydrogenase (short-subunit alcohol dehydrogenase family)